MEKRIQTLKSLYTDRYLISNMPTNGYDLKKHLQIFTFINSYH
jgi:hypothetical protein